MFEQKSKCINTVIFAFVFYFTLTYYNPLLPPAPSPPHFLNFGCFSYVFTDIFLLTRFTPSISFPLGSSRLTNEITTSQGVLFFVNDDEIIS